MQILDRLIIIWIIPQATWYLPSNTLMEKSNQIIKIHVFIIIMSFTASAELLTSLIFADTRYESYKP